MSVDFAKAFDTPRRECIIEALQSFIFGANIIKLIATVTQNTESCVYNGGWLSDWFQMERGIRKGCPLSSLLLIKPKTSEIQKSNNLQTTSQGL